MTKFMEVIIEPNTAVGYNALAANTTGSSNLAVGPAALAANTTGASNTVFGLNAMKSNTTANFNTAVGLGSLSNSISGSNNTSIGFSSLLYNTSGGNNTSVGYGALFGLSSIVNTLGTKTGGSGYTDGTYTPVTLSLVSGPMYTAPTATIVVSGGVVTTVTLLTFGWGVSTSTIFSATAASLGGTGSGFQVPVFSVSSGSNNTALGYNAGAYYTGTLANTTSTNSIYIGYTTIASANGNTNETVIGYNTTGNGSNTVTIGNTSITANYFTGSVRGGSFIRSGGTASQFLKADGSVDSTAYGTGSVTSVSALTIGTTGTDLSSTVATGTTTPVITLQVPTASASNRGALSSTDWTTFNNKITLASPITGYTVGTNTALVATDTLNAALGKLQGQVSARGTGTVTSVAAITLGTTGTDLSSTVATGTTTPVITLQVPTASAANRGALSSADWTTFNNKQAALTNPITGTGTAGQIALWSGTSTQNGSADFTWDDTNKYMVANLGLSGYVKYGSNSGYNPGFIVSAYGNFLFSSNARYSGTAWIYDKAGYASQFQAESTTGTATISTAPSGSAGGTATMTKRFSVTNAGRILLGVTLPTDDTTSALQVNGTIKQTSVTSSLLKTDSTGKLVAAVSGTDYVIPSALNAYLPLTGGILTGAIQSTTATFTTIGTGAAVNILGVTSAGLLTTANTLNVVTGTGTASYIPKFTAASTLGNSLVYDNGTSVGINTTAPNASAALQVVSTTQGFLPPVMTAAQKTAIASPATGLVIYQTDGIAGLYLYTGGAWRVLAIV